MPFPDYETFARCVQSASAGLTHDTHAIVVPIAVALLDDQLTPVLAYRRLVAPDQREATSFLFESVEGGQRQGRHSILGAQPAIEVIARQGEVRVLDHRGRRTDALPPVESTSRQRDPLEVPRQLTRGLKLVLPPSSPSQRGRSMPGCFLRGWVGFAAYDSVRYAEHEKLDWSKAPRDDRGLPDLHFSYYDGVVIFDHVDKLVYAVRLVEVPVSAGSDQIKAAYERGAKALELRAAELQAHVRPLSSGRIDLPLTGPDAPLASNVTKVQHAGMVGRALEYIRAGDIFQVVVGQRFERRSTADPFDTYRALRCVNPSPYMVYLQAAGCILVASSPEILCRVRPEGPGRELTVTNRPLAGTRKRGASPEEDLALEQDLLSDPKERAEHIMLVDLGRNDVGQVARPGSIKLPAIMQIERYSHVMHISSTVTGQLREGLDCWDALRAALPVGTISGAPKIRAMQIIDELEPVRRGPYGGGMGYVGLDGSMDIALALRTMVVPTAMRASGAGQSAVWTYHLQAAGGIVADSDPEAEYQETVNKAAALARAISVAESSFGT